MCYKISKKSASEKLALALPLPILFESRRKKLQRFLSLPILDVEKLWFPIINSWLAENFTFNQVLYLAIDRTSWTRINLMMVSIIYDNRAIPVYFELLPKLDSSNFTEQTKVFSKILPLFNKYRPIVLGDREFCSIKERKLVKAGGCTVLFEIKK